MKPYWHCGTIINTSGSTVGETVVTAMISWSLLGGYHSRMADLLTWIKSIYRGLLEQGRFGKCRLVVTIDHQGRTLQKNFTKLYTGCVISESNRMYCMQTPHFQLAPMAMSALWRRIYNLLRLIAVSQCWEHIGPNRRKIDTLSTAIIWYLT